MFRLLQLFLHAIIAITSIVSSKHFSLFQKNLSQCTLSLLLPPPTVFFCFQPLFVFSATLFFHGFLLFFTKKEGAFTYSFRRWGLLSKVSARWGVGSLNSPSLSLTRPLVYSQFVLPPSFSQWCSSFSTCLGVFWLTQVCQFCPRSRPKGNPRLSN